MNGPDGKKWTYGKIVEIFECGPYQIVKAIPQNPDPRNESTPSYHPFVRGEPTGDYSYTLDGALILAIAANHVPSPESNTMAKAAAKILNVSEG